MTLHHAGQGGNAETTRPSPGSPLGHLRVLALPGLAPLFLGKWLSDLGADVLRLEPPGGDPCRRLGPFANGRVDPDASLLWSFYAAGSRSVIVDPSTADGQELFRKLVTTADVLVEAFPPGTLETRGLGFSSLSEIRPSLIQVSLTPFGQTGPWATKKSSDLVNFALGGYLHMTGPAEGPPLKPSMPYQSQLHAANHGLLGLLVALRHRRRTGRGCHVDVAARDTGLWMLTHTYQHYDIGGINLKRQGAARDMGRGTPIRSIYRTRDGYVVWLFQTGPANAGVMRSLVKLMDSKGAAPAWLHDIRWEEVDLRSANAEERQRYDAVFRDFFATQTNAELFSWALEHGAMLAPVNTVAEVLGDPQLEARSAWTRLPDSNLGAGIRVPRSPVQMTEGRWCPRSRAPGIGEHTTEVLVQELGIPKSAIQASLSTGGA